MFIPKLWKLADSRVPTITWRMSPRETRTATRKTVTVHGGDVIVQCCPYMRVDQEVDFISGETTVEFSPTFMTALSSCSTIDFTCR